MACNMPTIEEPLEDKASRTVSVNPFGRASMGHFGRTESPAIAQLSKHIHSFDDLPPEIKIYVLQIAAEEGRMMELWTQRSLNRSFRACIETVIFKYTDKRCFDTKKTEAFLLSHLDRYVEPRYRAMLAGQQPRLPTLQIDNAMPLRRLQEMAIFVHVHTIRAGSICDTVLIMIKRLGKAQFGLQFITALFCDHSYGQCYCFEALRPFDRYDQINAAAGVQYYVLFDRILSSYTPDSTPGGNSDVLTLAIELEDSHLLQSVMRKVEYVISSNSNDIIVSKWFNVYHMTLAIRVGNIPAITMFLRTFDHHNLWKKAEFNQWLRCAIDEAVRNPVKIKIMDMILKKCPFRLSLVQLRSACRTWPESNVHVIRRVLRELPHAIHGATVGTNALFIAINSGSISSVKAVLGFTGANVNITRSVYRRSGYQIITPLEAALQSKRRNVVKYLLSYGASPPAWSKWPLQEQMYDILRVEFLKRMGSRKMLTYQEFRSLPSEQRSRHRFARAGRYADLLPCHIDTEGE